MLILKLTFAIAISVAHVQTKTHAFGAYPCRIFYFPMYAQSEGPMNSKSIEQEYDLTSVLKRKAAQIESLLRQKAGPTPKFDPKNVRVKLIDASNRVILLDLFQDVLSSGKVYKISKSTFKEIYDIIHEAIPDDT